MLVTLGADRLAAREAARACGLLFWNAARFAGGVLLDAATVLDVPADPAHPGSPFVVDLGRADAVLALPDAAAAKCSRRPHEAGLFLAAGLYRVVADLTNDGYGLVAFTGSRGEHLRVAYVIAAAPRAAAALGLEPTHGGAVDPAGTLTLEDHGDMKTITVRVTRTGDTTVATQGFTGTQCQDATRQLEQALGKVVNETATDEMHHRPVEHRATVNNG